MGADLPPAQTPVGESSKYDRPAGPNDRGVVGASTGLAIPIIHDMPFQCSRDRVKRLKVASTACLLVAC